MHHLAHPHTNKQTDMRAHTFAAAAAAAAPAVNGILREENMCLCVVSSVRASA